MAEIYDELGTGDAPPHCGRRRPSCSKSSTRLSGTRRQASTPTRWTAKRRRCSRSHPMPGNAYGPASSRRNAPRAVVKRLMSKDMWSGWGIRTLSADHPSFNPYNYQTGAVWPHDNSLIALGMRRYGFAAEAAAVARDISGAASHFLLNQLPELYAGLQRDPRAFLCNISAPTCRRPGQRGRRSCCCRRCLGCSRMRRAASSILTPPCRTGCPT